MNGKVGALNRFVSKAIDKCLPFFRVLKKSFEWTDECQKAFEDLKKYLSSPPLLSPSVPGEELYLYIAVSQATVSTALVRNDGRSCPHNRCAETQTIFPSSYNRGSDGPTFEESHEQPRGGKENGLVGN